MSFDGELLRYIHENLLEDGDTITAQDALIDRGLLDSIALVQIMRFVEEHEDVRIPDSHVTPDHFQSVESIGRLVSELKNPTAGES